jgi:hypothetical protein
LLPRSFNTIRKKSQQQKGHFHTGNGYYLGKAELFFGLLTQFGRGGVQGLAGLGCFLGSLASGACRKGRPARRQGATKCWGLGRRRRLGHRPEIEVVAGFEKQNIRGHDTNAMPQRTRKVPFSMDGAVMITNCIFQNIKNK